MAYKDAPEVEELFEQVLNEVPELEYLKAADVRIGFLWSNKRKNLTVKQYSPNV